MGLLELIVLVLLILWHMLVLLVLMLVSATVHLWLLGYCVVLNRHVTELLCKQWLYFPLNLLHIGVLMLVNPRAQLHDTGLTYGLYNSFLSNAA